MTKTYLRVTYRVAAHNTANFERALLEEVIPLARELQIRLHGVWKTSVGRVGEYVELWEFESMDDFDRKWTALMSDPRLQEIFRVTGAMVKDEQFSLLTRLAGSEVSDGEESQQ